MSEEPNPFKDSPNAFYVNFDSSDPEAAAMVFRAIRYAQFGVEMLAMLERLEWYDDSECCMPEVCPVCGARNSSAPVGGHTPDDCELSAMLKKVRGE